MNIKIITTEKKLTKSLINQMSISSTNTVKHGIKLGYVVNMRSKMSKALLICHEEKYSVFPMNYNKGELSIWRKAGGGFSQSIKFNSEKECDEFWEAYQEILNNVEQIYI